jgi:hypothetical protein
VPQACANFGFAALVPEGARFALLRHMLGSPRPVAIMLAVMAALMAGAMMMMR